jgi:hypothetical protein
MTPTTICRRSSDVRTFDFDAADVARFEDMFTADDKLSFSDNLEDFTSTERSRLQLILRKSGQFYFN